MQKKRSIIIVDDEPSMLDMLNQTLSDSGYACRAFTNAQEALESVKAASADLLLTDISMPGMRGLELTREVKRLHPEMSIIIMTGFVEEFSYDQAMEAGASDFIKKPFTVQELMMRIKHVNMQEKLRTISITDELTGLLNRRGFFTLAEQQLKVATRTKGKIALLFADVDNFKAINDTCGHQQGDEALIAMADIFRQTFRESDIIARMSGDEFAALLIDMPERSASCITGRLRQNIEAFNRAKGRCYRLSISLGLVNYDAAKPRSIDDLLKQADGLMYEEKLRKKGGQGPARPGEP